jgi:hypothetical protein
MNDPHSPLDNLSTTTVAIVILIIALICWVQKLPETHRQAARLRAYQRRSQWRKADLRHLERLGVHVSTPRLKQIETSKAPGRGVVRRYHSPDVMLRAGMMHFNAIFGSTTMPNARLHYLKKIPSLWNRVVEALYRGEHSLRKASRQRAPSVAAEEAVAQGLGLSSATVHKRCSKVRRERQGASPDFPALTLWQFEKWRQDGDLIWLELKNP